jgi:hypothetical protein
MVTVVPLVAIAYFVYEFARPPWTSQRVAGLLLLIPALTHGIYSRIRNPI